MYADAFASRGAYPAESDPVVYGDFHNPTQDARTALARGSTPHPSNAVPVALRKADSDGIWARPGDPSDGVLRCGRGATLDLLAPHALVVWGNMTIALTPEIRAKDPWQYHAVHEAVALLGEGLTQALNSPIMVTPCARWIPLSEGGGCPGAFSSNVNRGSGHRM